MVDLDGAFLAGVAKPEPDFVAVTLGRHDLRTQGHLDVALEPVLDPPGRGGREVPGGDARAPLFGEHAQREGKLSISQFLRPGPSTEFGLRSRSRSERSLFIRPWMMASLPRARSCARAPAS